MSSEVVNVKLDEDDDEIEEIQVSNQTAVI